jgi:sulfane dehydrogenase subunit SoxC
MTSRNENVTGPSGEDAFSRRKFLTVASAGVDTPADVPPREPGADLGGYSERSKYVQIGRIPEATPGKRNVDPSDAINSKTPLFKLVGALTPSDLHYERSRAGAPELDPAKHWLLVHGMAQKQLVLTVDDLKAISTDGCLGPASKVTSRLAQPFISAQDLG